MDEERERCQKNVGDEVAMSTRATIVIADGRDVYFIYRHCDGYPEIVVDDINMTINRAKGRWSGAEPGQLVSLFLAMHGDPNRRIQDYMLASGLAGDESYIYYLRFNYDGIDGWALHIPPLAGMQQQDSHVKDFAEIRLYEDIFREIEQVKHLEVNGD